MPVIWSEGGLFRVAQRNESWPLSRNFHRGSARLSRLSRQFATVGMQRNVRVACKAVRVAEWSGRKAGESGRARAKPCRGWRGARIGSVRPGFVPNTNFLPFAGRGAPVALSSRVATRFRCLTPRLKPSANLNGWNARKTFDNLRRSPRARCSERAASVTFVNQ